VTKNQFSFEGGSFTNVKAALALPPAQALSPAAAGFVASWASTRESTGAASLHMTGSSRALSTWQGISLSSLPHALCLCSSSVCIHS
jgi:hypothetical protein